MAALPESRISIVTIAVQDRDAMTSFYRDILGLRCFNEKGMTMFDVGGIVLGLWEREKFGEDTGRQIDAPSEFPGFAIAYNTRSEQEVDQVLSAVSDGGGTVTKNAHKTFWGGYGGYFADPEGNAWEVAYNPFWDIGADGRLMLPVEGETA